MVSAPSLCPSASLSKHRGSCHVFRLSLEPRQIGFQNGRISFNISLLYAKQDSQNSPGPVLLQGRGYSTDGVFLLTSCPSRSFLGPGELHLAMKMNVYRLAIMPNAPAKPGSNQWAHQVTEWCGVNRCVCTLALAGLLRAQRRPQQAR